MPRDVSGNYTLPAGNPVVPSTTISSSWANTTLSDIATALTASLSIDGSVTTAKIADDAVTPPKLAGLDVNGMVARISATEFEGRTITGTANKITVTDGDGVAGNPTLTLPDAVTLVTPTITGDMTGNTATFTGLVDFGTAPEPTTDSATDIGTSSKRWQHAYVEGVNFPATQVASADANTLDDYEEGTWTPVLSAATPGDINSTYTTQEATYTKIGRVVVANFHIVTSATNHTTASGRIQITGQPFTPGRNSEGALRIGNFDLDFANYASAVCTIAGGSATITVSKPGLNGNSVGEVQITEHVSGQGLVLIGQITFTV